jgi:hypothetical protein
MTINEKLRMNKKERKRYREKQEEKQSKILLQEYNTEHRYNEKKYYSETYES